MARIFFYLRRRRSCPSSPHPLGDHANPSHCHPRTYNELHNTYTEHISQSGGMELLARQPDNCLPHACMEVLSLKWWHFWCNHLVCCCTYLSWEKEGIEPRSVVGNSYESLHVLIVLIKQCVSLSTNGGTQLSGKLAPWNVNDNTN